MRNTFLLAQLTQKGQICDVMNDQIKPMPFGRACEHCQSPLETGRAKRGTIPRYCSDKCRVAAWRKRKGDKARQERGLK